jgi:hypothetical protein
MLNVVDKTVVESALEHIFNKHSPAAVIVVDNNLTVLSPEGKEVYSDTAESIDVLFDRYMSSV